MTEPRQNSVLFLDCQTTGMHPSMGKILEIAWRAQGVERSFLLRLEEGEEIPDRVTEITGIRPEDMIHAVAPEIAFSAFETDLQELGEDAWIIAHYAQFERSFLEDLRQRLRGERPLPWNMLCTFKISNLLFPEVPSRNIRALTGFFKLGDANIQRAMDHVQATEKLWSKLESDLADRGLIRLEDIEAWTKETKAKRPAKLEYRVDRILRLSLPDRPGIYRMMGSGGNVLYVGKATSLRSRVNSYFRGIKSPGRRKREMLAQVCDIQITECGSPLEAALLESEEIKRLDPPYNVSLKAGRRKLVFFDQSLRVPSLCQDTGHPLGPFPRNNAIDPLIQWQDSVKAGEPAQIFHEEVPPEVLLAGHRLFCARYGISAEQLPSLRSLVALGILLGKVWETLADRGEQEESPEEEIEAVDSEEGEAFSSESVADRLEGLLVRAGWEYLRAKRLTSLLNCKVSIPQRDAPLLIRDGKLAGFGEAPAQDGKAAPWENLGIGEYDRMSVLLTEIGKHGYPVESLHRS